MRKSLTYLFVTSALSGVLAGGLVAQQPQPAAPAPAVQTPAPPANPAAGAPGQRGRGQGGDPFAGQSRIKALIVSGGCCHDYSGEAKVMMDAIGRVLPVD